MHSRESKVRSGVGTVQPVEMSMNRLAAPEGHVLIPVSEGQKEAPLKLCVLVKAPGAW